MIIKKAKAMGQCFGVKNALKRALLEENKGNLTIAGQLVHNPQTVKKLLDFGIYMVDNFEKFDDIKTEKVMITAHGSSDKIKDLLKEKKFIVEDATCPLVSLVHKTIKSMVKKGLFPVVIGRPEHVEVKGILGDLSESFVVFNEEDIERLKKLNKKKLGIVSQTTNQPEVVEDLVKKIKKIPAIEYVEFENTVCKPTRDRQEAVKELANEVELMIVVGGYNSSNTKKLVNICKQKNVKVYHIEKVSELEKKWFENINIVGITAGTSTPEDIIEKVFSKIKYISENL